MTGWNLPPGCNVRDLPGNEPEDPIAEGIYELLYAKLSTKIVDELLEELNNEVMKFVEDARRVAYSEGSADTSLACAETMEQALIDLSFRGLATQVDGVWKAVPAKE